MSQILASGQKWMELLIVAEPGNAPGGSSITGGPNITMPYQDASGSYGADDSANWSLTVTNPSSDSFTFVVQGTVPANRDGWRFCPIGSVTFEDGNTYLARLETIQVGAVPSNVTQWNGATPLPETSEIPGGPTVFTTNALLLNGIVPSMNDDGSIRASDAAGSALATSAATAALATSLAALPTPPSASTIANTILAQGVAAVEGSANPHSLAYVILAMSEWTVSTEHPTQLTVFRSDGVTPFATKTVARQAYAKPIVGVT